MTQPQITGITKHFHVAFTEHADHATPIPWLAQLKQSFADDRQPEVHVTALMTREEFEAMTGRDDIENFIGYLLEHYEGPAIFGIDMAKHHMEDLVEEINEHLPEDMPGLQARSFDDIPAEGWEAAISMMQGVTDFDWKLQSELINEDLVKEYLEQIPLFTEPCKEEEDED